MNAPSEDVKDMLVAESGLNLAFNSNLFVGRVPPKPPDAVTIIDSYGYPPDLGLTEADYERPGIQIIVRNRDYNVGMQLAQDIKATLHGRKHETWNGALYLVLTCLGNPALLEWTENNLATFSINFNLQRRAV